MKREARIVLVVVFTVLVGNAISYSLLRNRLKVQEEERLKVVRSEKEAEIVRQLQGWVDAAYATVESVDKTFADTKAAQNEAIKRLQGFRQGKTYVWTHRVDPSRANSAFMLVHPAQRLLNKDLSGLLDLNQVESLYLNGNVYEWRKMGDGEFG